MPNGRCDIIVVFVWDLNSFILGFHWCRNRGIFSGGAWEIMSTIRTSMCPWASIKWARRGEVRVLSFFQNFERIMEAISGESVRGKGDFQLQCGAAETIFRL